MAKFDFLLQKQCKDTFGNLIDIIITTFGKENSGNWIFDKIQEFELKVKNEKEEDPIEKNFGKRKDTINKIMKGSSESEEVESGSGIYMGVLLKKRKFLEIGNRGIEMPKPKKKLKCFRGGVEVNRKFEEDGVRRKRGHGQENLKGVELKVAKKRQKKKLRKRKARSQGLGKIKKISSFRKKSSRLRKKIGKIENPTLIMLEEKEKKLFKKGVEIEKETRSYSLGKLEKEKEIQKKPEVVEFKAESSPETQKEVKEDHRNDECILDMIESHFDDANISLVDKDKTESLESRRTEKTEMRQIGEALKEDRRVRSSSRLKKRSHGKDGSKLLKIEKRAEKKVKSKKNIISSKKKSKKKAKSSKKKEPIFEINREKKVNDSYIQTLFLNNKGQIQKGPLVEKSKVDVKKMYEEISKHKDKIINSDDVNKILVSLIKMKETITEMEREEAKAKEIQRWKQITQRGFEKKKQFNDEEKTLDIIKENLKKKNNFEKIVNPINYDENSNFVMYNKNFELLSSDNSKSYFSYSPINFENLGVKTPKKEHESKEFLSSSLQKLTLVKEKSFEKKKSPIQEKEEIIEKSNKENKSPKIEPPSSPVIEKKVVRFTSALAKPYIDTADNRIAKYPKSSEKIEKTYFSPKDKTKLKKIYSVTFLNERQKTGIICSGLGNFVFTLNENQKNYSLRKLKIPDQNNSEYLECMNFGLSKVSIFLDYSNSQLVKVSFEGFTKISSSSDFKDLKPFKMLKLDTSKTRSGVILEGIEARKTEKLVLLGISGKIVIMGNLMPNCKLEAERVISVTDRSQKSGKFYNYKDLYNLIFSKRNYFSTLAAVNYVSNEIILINSETGIVISKSYLNVEEELKVCKICCFEGIIVLALSEKLSKKIKILKIYKFFPKTKIIQEMREFYIDGVKHAFSLVYDQTTLEIVNVGEKNYIILAENYGKLLKMMIEINSYDSIGAIGDRIEASELSDLVKLEKVEFYIEEKNSVKRQKNIHCCGIRNKELWSFGNFGYLCRIRVGCDEKVARFLSFDK